jgi:tol-pal system protein YbgF
MTPSRNRPRFAVLAALPLLLVASAAMAQDRSGGGFLDNLFKRGEQPSQQGQASPPPEAGGPPPVAQAGDASRIDRIESALRQLTGTIEQLQHQNQQLEMRLQRMQDDTEYRFQQLGARAAPGTAPQPRAIPQQGPVTAPGTAPGVVPDRRTDVFNPAAHPDAPGAPRVLGNQSAMAVPPQNNMNEPSVGGAGAPLDLSTLSGNPPPPPPVNGAPMAGPPMAGAPMAEAPANGAPVTRQPPVQSQLPPPPRNTSAPGPQLATLPPSATPQDEYDMAYGYVLHKDYALAEQAFRDFLSKYPQERLVPDAQYWLGESMFQRQRYRDAAESFLAVSTKFEHSGKAPNALLRLGQSLAAMHQKEAACATLAEIGRKYPKASATVKRGVTQELKSAHC